eukprot:2369678-Rhodomonas_salina.1
MKAHNHFWKKPQVDDTTAGREALLGLAFMMPTSRNRNMLAAMRDSELGRLAKVPSRSQQLTSTSSRRGGDSDQGKPYRA